VPLVKPEPRPIAVQLYTLREEATRDLEGTLGRLARTGFVGIEPADLHGRSPREFAALAADLGLAICSSHGFAVGDAAPGVLDAAAELGSPLVVVPVAGPERFGAVDAVKGVAEELNRASELARERGLGLAYHNHFWEWAAHGDGRLAYDVLAAELAPEVELELDVYWAVVAGQDPVQVAKDHGTRVTRLHLKDGPADDPDSPMTAAGDGVVDLAAAVAGAPAATWGIVELDRCDTDMFEAVEQSYKHLVGTGLSRGRS
jgi:sugar phosphate isomerase/epimerase